MYEFLKALFGNNADGTPVALTWEQLEQKIAADSKLKLVNLADGGYVSKEKFDAKDLELKEVTKQRDEANDTIKSHTDIDIDGIKKSAADWEEKYKKDTEDLQAKLSRQELEFAAKTYLSGFNFSNDLVREAIYDKFMAKGLAREGDKFLGADDFMAEMQKQYPTAFITEDPAAPKPKFADPNPKPSDPPKKLSLREMMAYKNEHPEAKIDFN